MSRQERARVIAEARTWLGTPYHPMGRIKGVGVDCATLLCEVYEATGVVQHVDPGTYAPDWHLHHGAEQYLGWLQKYAVETVAPMPGDVIVWRFGRCFAHGAILVDDQTIIHSYLGQGVRLEDRHAAVFADRAVKYFTMWTNK
jgi:NlpC/P60 family putative phage cell wall peptidase